VRIMQGVLELGEKCAADYMFPLGTANPRGAGDDRTGTFMLSWDAVLDMDKMAELISLGHSRVPVYQGRRDNVRGVLLVKKCIVVDPEDRRKVSTMPLSPPMFVGQGLNMQHLLNSFQKQRRHFAIVCRDPPMCQACIQRGEATFSFSFSQNT
jgi:metal transporter CNNM